MQNQGILVQSHPELKASENARRETILMRGSSKENFTAAA
jgi:hypothetical protein